MKIVATSDLHGYLPDDFPKGDILLIAGDICIDGPAWIQLGWLDTNFRSWLKTLPYKDIICTWGNHDWVGMERPYDVKRLDLPCKFLVDEEVEVQGLRIYGTPHQPVFYDWAFNLKEPELAEKWKLIPEGIDILLLHGPPHGFGDLSHDWDVPGKPLVHTGSPSLTERIKEVKPKLAVAGHIHPQAGLYEIPGFPEIKLANVSYVDDKYQPKNPPFVFEL